MQESEGAFQILFTAGTRISNGHDPNKCADPWVPLQNLSIVRTRMDSLQSFLSRSLNSNVLVSKCQMNLVTNEIVSSIHQTLINGAALVSYSQNLTAAGASMFPATKKLPDTPDTAPCKKSQLDCSGTVRDKQLIDLKVEVFDNEGEDCEDDGEIVELDAMELLAEHFHFCEICGKGFRRDANLRMHMRAHGNQFKTPKALAKPSGGAGEMGRKGTRFSCPLEGCNRNKLHNNFRPLKSIVCVKNHFKRNHCPKMYSCNRCHKKNFSVLSDLRSHLKHCGESKWKCTCGNTFSRKDKLFGHISLFEGHMPALAVDEEEKGQRVVAMDAEDDDNTVVDRDLGIDCLDNGLPEGFFDDIDGFGSIENYCLHLRPRVS